MGPNSESGNHETTSSETHNVADVRDSRNSPTSLRDGETDDGRGERQDDAEGAEWSQPSQERLTTMSPSSSVSRNTNSVSDDQDDVLNHRHRRSTSFSRVRLLESASPSPSSPNQRRPRRFSHTEESEGDPSPSPKRPPEDEKAVTWRSLPKKGQLAILTIARLAEPLTQTSLQAYMFYQLKSFDPSLPDSTIASRAGILQASFTAAQFLTAVLWGRIADSEVMGRKKVLIVGLFGTGLSSVGFGFSKSFAVAAVFRTMGGALNSNVGVMRTMISEMVEKQ